MDSKKFIIYNLRELYSSLPYLEIRYEYRHDIVTHIIEVKPVHCYDKDRSYVSKQIALEETFEEMFPYEEILFMTENALIQIEKPLLELGISQKDTISTQVVLADIIEYQTTLKSTIAKLFETLSKVNADNSSYFHFKCLPVHFKSLEEDYYKVSLPNVSEVCEPPLGYEKRKRNNKTTKKDSEYNQSLFFFINIAI